MRQSVVGIGASPPPRARPLQQSRAQSQRLLREPLLLPYQERCAALVKSG